MAGDTVNIVVCGVSQQRVEKQCLASDLSLIIEETEDFVGMEICVCGHLLCR